MAAYSVQGPHQTSGLAGYPARDYMAPGGTPVYSWSVLRVARVSGGSGRRATGIGGFNLYLTDPAGRNYFVTHVENLRVKAGDVIRPGQQIATVGRYEGMATHVHIGYQGGDPVNTLGLRPEYVFTAGGAVAGAKPVADATARSRLGGGGRSIYDIPGVVRGPGGVPLVPGPLPLIEGGIAIGKHVPGVSGIAKTAATVEDALAAPGDAIRWMAGNWDRVLEVAGGILLVLVGLILMGRSLGVTKTKVELVEKVGAYQGAREFAAAGSPAPATREDLTTGTTHEVTDAGERRAARRARAARGTGSAQTDEIPY